MVRTRSYWKKELLLVKEGRLIPETVERIFEKFLALLKDVPLDVITVTYEIIDNLRKISISSSRVSLRNIDIISIVLTRL